MIEGNRWQKIWNKRQIKQADESELLHLMKANGYDSKFSIINQEEWKKYLTEQAKKLNISGNDSIFEVGCGAGAFLYPFYQKGHQVSGMDYSSSLLELAKEKMGKDNFYEEEAINLETKDQFDIVISSSVFLYFPSYEYAEEVLIKMIKIAKKSIGIFDIPNLETKERALAQRKSTLGEEEYNQKYQGLDHLFYSHNWFREKLANKFMKIAIEPQFIKDYDHSDYRFNVYIHK